MATLDCTHLRESMDKLNYEIALASEADAAEVAEVAEVADTLELYIRQLAERMRTTRERK